MGSETQKKLHPSRYSSSPFQVTAPKCHIVNPYLLRNPLVPFSVSEIYTQHGAVRLSLSIRILFRKFVVPCFLM